MNGNRWQTHLGGDGRSRFAIRLRNRPPRFWRQAVVGALANQVRSAQVLPTAIVIRRVGMNAGVGTARAVGVYPDATRDKDGDDQADDKQNGRG